MLSSPAVNARDESMNHFRGTTLVGGCAAPLQHPMNAFPFHGGSRLTLLGAAAPLSQPLRGQYRPFSPSACTNRRLSVGGDSTVSPRHGVYVGILPVRRWSVKGEGVFPVYFIWPETGCQPKIASICFSSSALKAGPFRASTFSRICWGRLAPMRAEVTTSSRSTHCSAICASV